MVLLSHDILNKSMTNKTTQDFYLNINLLYISKKEFD